MNAHVYSKEQESAGQTIERLAWIMDRSIPIGGGYSVGLDPILGLVPGVGDLIGTAVSSIIIVQAHRAGVPKPTVLRMMANVAIDSAVGAIPVAGDVFDFAFKANQKNLKLYREASRGLRNPTRDLWFLILLVLGLGLLFALPVLALLYLIRAIF